MGIIEDFLSNILSNNPILTLILFTIILIAMLYKFINLFVKIKEIQLRMEKKMDNYQENTEDRICDLEDKVEDYHNQSTDKFNLISNKITDKWTSSMNNLVDRLANLSKEISNILILLKNER